ncbi:MAG: serine/threonine protein kinase [Proteobacteria bacterium]|nr:serine/threonine protein kinase [Pseudomonadota bacterium]
MPMNPSDPRISLPEQPTVLDVAQGADDGSQTLEQGQRVGPYRIDRLLGMGGMGAVYLAEQLEPIQRPVALKLIRGQLRGGLAEAYFLVERQALARMDHPAIAKVYDAGSTPQGHLFFAMEWIDGQTLTHWCDEHALALHERIELFVRVCKGVQHAHQKGVIHRDLKPGNILVAQVDGQPMPKIIDFGVATGTDSGQGSTSVAQSVGTRGYMSPEQMAGRPGEVDIRSDVYALGIIAFELFAPRERLAATVPAGLNSDNLHAALLDSLQGRTSTNAEIAACMAAIPVPLRWVITRAIAPAKADRYESAQKLADDLDNFLGGYPVEAAPATRSYRLRCFARRNRLTLVAGAVVAFALIVGTTAAVLGMLRARDEAARANLEARKAHETTTFLTDVLSGVDPEKARDMDKTLLHLILDDAAKRASTELAAQPEVLATIESAISASYNSLGDYRQSLDHARRGLAAARSALGQNALPTLKLQRQIAKETGYLGDFKSAVAILDGVAKTMQGTLGNDAVETLSTRLDMVEDLEQLGRFDEAQHLLDAIVPAIDRKLGRDDDLTIRAHEAQATLATYRGDYVRAEPIFKDVIARETRRWGAQSPKVIDTLNEFAIMYLESKRYAQGAAILQQLLPVVEKMYGPDHSATINVVSNLAGALRQQGMPDKVAASGPYYQRAYETIRRKFGDKHPNTIIATGNYGNYFLDIGQTVRAIELERTAVAGALALYGPDNELTGEMQVQLGKALLKAGDYAEAQTHLLAAVREKQKDFGADHWRMADYIDPLIEAYKAGGQTADAEKWEAAKAALKPKPAGEG